MDASWAISALLALGFLLAALMSTGALAVGWFLLAVGMVVVAVVRYRSRSRT